MITSIAEIISSEFDVNNSGLGATPPERIDTIIQNLKDATTVFTVELTATSPQGLIPYLDANLFPVTMTDILNISTVQKIADFVGLDGAVTKGLATTNAVAGRVAADNVAQAIMNTGYTDLVTYIQLQMSSASGPALEAFRAQLSQAGTVGQQMGGVLNTFEAAKGRIEALKGIYHEAIRVLPKLIQGGQGVNLTDTLNLLRTAGLVDSRITRLITILQSGGIIYVHDLVNNLAGLLNFTLVKELLDLVNALNADLQAFINNLTTTNGLNIQNGPQLLQLVGSGDLVVLFKLLGMIGKRTGLASVFEDMSSTGLIEKFTAGSGTTYAGDTYSIADKFKSFDVGLILKVLQRFVVLYSGSTATRLDATKLQTIIDVFQQLGVTSLTGMNQGLTNINPRALLALLKLMDSTGSPVLSNYTADVTRLSSLVTAGVPDIASLQNRLGDIASLSRITDVIKALAPVGSSSNFTRLEQLSLLNITSDSMNIYGIANSITGSETLQDVVERLRMHQLPYYAGQGLPIEAAAADLWRLALASPTYDGSGVITNTPPTGPTLLGTSAANLKSQLQGWNANSNKIVQYLRVFGEYDVSANVNDFITLMKTKLGITPLTNPIAMTALFDEVINLEWSDVSTVAQFFGLPDVTDIVTTIETRLPAYADVVALREGLVTGSLIEYATLLKQTTAFFGVTAQSTLIDQLLTKLSREDLVNLTTIGRRIEERDIVAILSLLDGFAVQEAGSLILPMKESGMSTFDSVNDNLEARKISILNLLVPLDPRIKGIVSDLQAAGVNTIYDFQTVLAQPTYRGFSALAKLVLKIQGADTIQGKLIALQDGITSMVTKPSMVTMKTILVDVLGVDELGPTFDTFINQGFNEFADIPAALRQRRLSVLVALMKLIPGVGPVSAKVDQLITGLADAGVLTLDDLKDRIVVVDFAIVGVILEVAGITQANSIIKQIRSATGASNINDLIEFFKDLVGKISGGSD